MATPAQQGARGGFRGGFRGSRGGSGGRGGGGGGFRGRGRGRGRGGPPGQNLGNRLTHFLALPLDQHRDLRDRVTTFRNGILQAHASNPINGLDATIFQAEQRLHITLGVMTLAESGPPAGESSTPSEEAEESGAIIKTIPDALLLLQTLRGEIMEIINGSGQLQIPLKGLASMTGKKEEAHVLYTGPGLTQDESSLWKISLLVHERFKQAGFVTETRPLKLHCTLLNTTFRRSRRFPFSFNGVLRAIASNPSIVGLPVSPEPTTGAIEQQAYFGEYPVDEIHIYEMGSWDKDKRYISVGHISLTETETQI